MVVEKLTCGEMDDGGARLEDGEKGQTEIKGAEERKTATEGRRDFIYHQLHHCLLRHRQEGKDGPLPTHPSIFTCQCW